MQHVPGKFTPGCSLILCIRLLQNVLLLELWTSTNGKSNQVLWATSVYGCQIYFLSPRGQNKMSGKWSSCFPKAKMLLPLPLHTSSHPTDNRFKLTCHVTSFHFIIPDWAWCNLTAPEEPSSLLMHSFGFNRISLSTATCSLQCMPASILTHPKALFVSSWAPFVSSWIG